MVTIGSGGVIIGGGAGLNWLINGAEVGSGVLGKGRLKGFGSLRPGLPSWPKSRSIGMALRAAIGVVG